MSIQQMSLPVDVPWKRLAASREMMDSNLGDSTLPPRWRSSLAIFYADAEPSDLYCDRIITYIKVVCTITGYQVGAQELGYDFVPPSLQSPIVRQPTRQLLFHLPASFDHVAHGVNTGRVGRSVWKRLISAVRRKLPKHPSLQRTVELKPGEQLVSSSDSIAQSVQLDAGQLREPPAVALQGNLVTVRVRPAPRTTFAAQASYQVANTLASWGSQTIESFRETVEAYRPCHGAMLQVTAYPASTDGAVSIDDYPYIVAFEPKKRELYEAVTSSGETLSASSSNVNVRKGTTSTNETENSSIFGGVDTEVKVFGTGGGAGISGEWGSRQRGGAENINMTTTDASREKRESLAHSTSLTQLYTLLQSYHLATNRSLFLLLPRPHQVQQFFSFANGPRELEGVQEFFLVSSRPKSVKGLCVAARLETAHVVDEERSRQVGQERYDYRVVRQTFRRSYTGNGWVEKIVTVQVPDGYALDWEAVSPAYVADWDTFEYDAFPCAYEIALSESLVQVTISMYDDNNEDQPTKASGTVVVRCKSIEPVEVPTEEQWIESDLVITARQVSGCVATTNSKPSEGAEESAADGTSVEATEGVLVTPNASSSEDNNDNDGSVPSDNDSTDPQAEHREEHHTEKADSRPRSGGGDGQRRESLGQRNNVQGEDWLTYETTIPVVDDRLEGSRLGRRIRVSNLMIPRVAQAMIESIGSRDRHKLGERRISEARYIAREIARVVARLPKDHPANSSLENIKIAGDVAGRLQELNIRQISDLARHLPTLERALRDPRALRTLQDLVLKVAGLARESKQ